MGKVSRMVPILSNQKRFISASCSRLCSMIVKLFTRLLLLTLISLFGGFIYLSRFRDRFPSVAFREGVTTRNGKQVKKPIQILYYTRVWQYVKQERWISDAQCTGVPVGSCLLHSNKSLISESDAVVFEPRFIDGIDLEKIPRRSEQIFVFSIREAAQRVEKPKVPDYFFNASMSYLSTADIPYNHRYQWIRKDESEKRGLTFVPIGFNKALFQKKSHFLSAMIGNCASTPSGRTKLVKYLEKRKYLSLFGDCSKDPEKKNVCKKRDDDCVNRIFEESFFFLALENSVCVDYVTEKYWNRTTIPSVPIMWSRKAAGKQGIPENSAIYVDDFETIGEMIDHLEYLRSNLTAYQEYFLWRNDYMLITKRESRECQLCSYVYRKPLPKVYKDAYQTFKEQTDCQKDFLEKFLKF